MRIKSISCKNIQSLRDVVIDFPEEGVVCFFGDNSSGKSVIRKVIEDTLSNAIATSRVRHPLISSWAMFGELEITTYEGHTFKLIIHREARETKAILTHPDGSEITRYLSDKAIPSMLMELGFHYNKDRDLSLSIVNTDKGLLFFSSSPVINGELLLSALTDEKAEMIKESINTSLKELYVIKKRNEDEIQVNSKILDNLPDIDILKEQSKLMKVSKYLSVLQNVYIPKIEPLEPVPRVSYIELPKVRLHKLVNPTLVNVYTPTLVDLQPIQNDIDIIRKEECPLCGQKLCQHQ